MLTAQRLKEVLNEISQKAHDIFPEDKFPQLYKDYPPANTANTGIFSPRAQSPAKKMIIDENAKLDQFLRDSSLSYSGDTPIWKAVEIEIARLKTTTNQNKLEKLKDFIVDIKQGRNHAFGRIGDIDGHFVLKSLIEIANNILGIPRHESTPMFSPYG